MRFTVHAYEKDCPYSTKVLDYFRASGSPQCTILTYDKYNSNDRPPKHPKINTMPRIFFGDHLVANCDKWFDVLGYVDRKWKRAITGEKWTNNDTTAITDRMLEGVHKRVACKVVLSILHEKDGVE